LDLDSVLTSVVSRVVQLTRSGGGVIWEFDEEHGDLHVRATHAIEPELAMTLEETPIRVGEGALGKAVQRRAPVQVPDLLEDREFVVLLRARGVLIRSGFRSLLAVPLLLGEQRTLGGLTLWRQEPGRWPDNVVRLVRSFAATSALAIQNAR